MSDLVAAEDQQVQVDLARTPALALLTAHRLLDALEGGEQCECTRLRVRAGRDVERDDCVQEVRLVDHADRLRA